MTDVQFDEQMPVAVVREERQSLLSNLVIKSGLAKDAAGAQKVLLIIAVTAFLATAALIVFGNFGQGPAPQDIEAEIRKG